MALDGHANFAASVVTSAPAPPSSGLTLTVANGAIFPTAPFNCTVCPEGAIPTTSNAEIVRVTAKSGNDFTIVRAQEGSTARAIQSGDVIAATITAKWMDDVVNMANHPGGARTDISNTFTANQIVSAITPEVRLNDTGAAANQRLFRLINTGGRFLIQAVDDAVTTSVHNAFFDRTTGMFFVTGGFAEAGRTVQMGYWTNVPFNAANFYSEVGTWTVEPGDIITNAYTIVGKTLIWCLYVNASSIAGSPSQLRLNVPTGTIALGFGGLGCVTTDGFAAMGNITGSMVGISRPGSLPFTNTTNGTFIAGMFMFPMV